jgi:ATP-dependent DNA helicase RecG
VTAAAPPSDLGALPSLTAPRRAALERLGVTSCEDLLRLAPRRHEDRRHPTQTRALEDGAAALVIGRVTSSRAVRTRGGLSLLEARVADDVGTVRARWFYRGFLPRPLPVGRLVALYGVAARRGEREPEMRAPELERLDEAETPGPGRGRLVPVHPLTKGLTAPAVRRLVWEALERGSLPADALPEAIRARFDLPPLAWALRALHFPEVEADAERARRRLAFDELLAHERELARRRAARTERPAWPIPFPPRVEERIRKRLPFSLTAGQERAVAEVVADLRRAHPMLRLVQGEVGSGKTAVAAYAVLGAVAARLQAAVMAPTEILARQHAATFERLLADSRVRIEVLLGSREGTRRTAALARVAAGEADLVIGTHAVISEAVRFARLGLVVVDEQHRFGVLQRRRLVEKGAAGGRVPHALVMTATPIPRTLAMTVMGDLDLSVVEGLPPGRGRTDTWVVRPAEGRRVFARVRSEIEAGHQAYVVYPLVEESDRVALRDARAGFERWRRALPRARVGLLHGRLAREEKEAVMEAFRRRALDLLVATIVLEVGVDVPNATVLVVEHAERFGLSQLHQLRGRVGRGGDDSLCVLVDRSPRATPARLDVLARTTDGFEIAEEDLRLRGLGDLLGTRQHGRPHFAAASLPKDLPLLAAAREVAMTPR